MYGNKKLQAVTAHTAVTLPQLRALLDRDRAVGLAWSDEFFEAGISSVAAAVLDSTGSPVAALNVTGQVAAFEGEARRVEIGRAAAEAAEEISRHIGWNGGGTRVSTLKVVA